MWYQLTIEICHRDEIETLSEQLEESGALSITLMDKNDNPVLEPEPGAMPLWPDIIINALYDDEVLAETTKTLLSQQLNHLIFTVIPLADQDWERVWMDDFKPQCFGERLWICPSWCEPPQPQAVNLILDPGLAFGTGTHPTTALCLNWLDQTDIKDHRVIDYGCGSGILSLAALKLGAAQVQAVDIDPQALQATRNNAELNQITSSQLYVGFPESLHEQTDLLIANILLAPLITLQNQFKALLKESGTLVISGILAEQAAELIKAYEFNFKHHQAYYRENWALLTFKPY